MTTPSAFTRRATLALVLVAALASPALAGPPLVCFPFDIGTARSLPWAPDTGWKGLRDDYDLTKLTSDTTSICPHPRQSWSGWKHCGGPRCTRRATKRREGLLDWIEPARRRGNRQRQPRALALFDAGYLIEVYKQLTPISAKTGELAASLDGYAMVRQSLALSGNDPAIEFAAALMT